MWPSLHSNPHFLLFYHWSELHIFTSNLHLHSHDACFVNVFDPFIFVIMLITLRSKSSVLFWTHTLLDKSLRVLQLPTNLSNLTANGHYWNTWLYSLGCKLLRVGWILHLWLLNGTTFVWLDALATLINNPINIFLLSSSNITLYFKLFSFH